jgi:peptidoglycan/LPS O-acetylase OafA/YrhL
MLIKMHPASPSGFSLGYRPALDGLRAVSILAVLAHHSHWLSGGFLGVDLFFALSGFLITALLTEEFARTGTITLRLFYARRALRLLPALLLLLVVCAGSLLATLPAEYGPAVIHAAAAVLFYVANWAWLFDVSLGVFGHTWSLGIEEQFYLLWPCALLVMLRVSSPRRVFAITLALAGAGVAWRHALVLAGAPFQHLYSGLDAHGDSLLIGCALSLGLTAGLRLPGRSTLAALVGVGGLAGLLVFATYPDSYVRHHVSSAAALVVSPIIAHVVSAPRSPLTRLLAAAPLVAIGRISYGVYLWHFPVFYLFGLVTVHGTAATTSWLSIAAAWAVSFGAAGISYAIVERPALALKRTLQPLRTEPIPPHDSVPATAAESVAVEPGDLDARGRGGDRGPTSAERGAT